MKRLRHLLLIGLLSGCTLLFPHRPDCEEIMALHSLVGQRMSQQELTAYITEQYGIASGGIRVEKLRGETIIRWEKPPVDYNASIEDGMLHHVFIHGTRWTLDQLIACLGVPEVYSAKYEYATGMRTDFSIHVLMPNLGIHALGYEFHKSPAKRSHADPRGSFPIYSISIDLPAKYEEMLYKVYGSDKALYAQILEEYRPWPGDANALEVIIDSDVQKYWDLVGDEGETDPRQ